MANTDRMLWMFCPIILISSFFFMVHVDHVLPLFCNQQVGMVNRAFSHIISTMSCSLFGHSELLPQRLHPAWHNCFCSASWICVVSTFGPSRLQVVVHVSTIPRRIAAWQRHCLLLLQPWESRLVSWHVVTYLASLSLSLSFVMKESCPMSTCTDFFSVFLFVLIEIWSGSRFTG